jgi:hypothetical protein
MSSGSGRQDVVGTGDLTYINLGCVVGARGFVGNDQTLAGDDYPAVFEQNLLPGVPYHPSGGGTLIFYLQFTLD